MGKEDDAAVPLGRAVRAATTAGAVKRDIEAVSIPKTRPAAHVVAFPGSRVSISNGPGTRQEPRESSTTVCIPPHTATERGGSQPNCGCANADLGTRPPPTSIT